MIQVIVPSSEKYHVYLPGFMYLWGKYVGSDGFEVVVCSSRRPEGYNGKFYKTGVYSSHEWSDKLIGILENVADEVFILLLDDYWLVRPVNTYAVRMMYDYMHQFEYVVKFDLTTDRLYSDPGFYLYGYNTYNTLGYLDLIKSKPSTSYHLSLWGGLWRRDLLKEVLIPGETAQQIELNGTHRLSQKGDEVLVLGTRQAPMKHANIIQAGKFNTDPMVGLPALTEGDREELKELGYL